jgi:hypothetical protein
MAAGVDLDNIPKPITPGPEMAALARFHTDVTWTGTIQPGGMGPGTPAMTATGWRTPRDHPGRPLDRWHLPAGPVPTRRHLRAHLAAALGRRLGPDDQRVPGHARRQLRPRRCHARLDRRQPPDLETIGDPPVRLRLVWDRSDPAEMIWRNEMAVGGALVPGRGVPLQNHMTPNSACS